MAQRNRTRPETKEEEDKELTLDERLDLLEQLAETLKERVEELLETERAYLGRLRSHPAILRFVGDQLETVAARLDGTLEELERRREED